MGKKTSRVYVLNPSQSRRLIAKGMAALPQIQFALESGKIFIGRGSTNAYVLEELLKEIGDKRDINKGDYVAGQIAPGEKFMNWTVNPGPQLPEYMIHKKKLIAVENRVKTIMKFKEGDIFIKGGNAIDRNGVPAVIVAAKDGGTIGTSLGILLAKGIEIICPIGLEKMVSSDLIHVQQYMGIQNVEHTFEGFKAGIIPMPTATVLTEVDALETLFDCDAYHVASGGVGGAEGSVSILVNAIDEEELKAIDGFMKEIANEPKYQPNL